MTPPDHSDLLSGTLWGHSSIERDFIQLLKRGHLPLVWMVVGPGGVGKRTFCLRALTLLLEGRTSFQISPDSCNVLQRVQALTHPDCLIFGKEQAPLSVEGVRTVGQFLQTTTFSGGHRVVCIEHIHTLNAHGFNSLLKDLEEPPSDTTFFLTTTTLGAVPATLRSRCHIAHFHPLSLGDFKQGLEQPAFRTYQIQDPEALYSRTNGCLGQALDLLDKDCFEGIEKIYRLLNQDILGSNPCTPDEESEIVKFWSGQSVALLQESIFGWLRSVFIQGVVGKDEAHRVYTHFSGEQWEEKIQKITVLFQQATTFHLGTRHVLECVRAILALGAAAPLAA